jgi:hypothetical protein
VCGWVGEWGGWWVGGLVCGWVGGWVLHRCWVGQAAAVRRGHVAVEHSACLDMVNCSVTKMPQGWLYVHHHTCTVVLMSMGVVSFQELQWSNLKSKAPHSLLPPSLPPLLPLRPTSLPLLPTDPILQLSSPRLCREYWSPDTADLA